MTSSRGRMCMKTLFTQGAILCVCGDLKCTLSTTTVTHMLQHHMPQLLVISVLGEVQRYESNNKE
jgi:hypothetical protein